MPPLNKYDRLNLLYLLGMFTPITTNSLLTNCLLFLMLFLSIKSINQNLSNL